MEKVLTFNVKYILYWYCWQRNVYNMEHFNVEEEKTKFNHVNSILVHRRRHCDVYNARKNIGNKVDIISIYLTYRCGRCLHMINDYIYDMHNVTQYSITIDSIAMLTISNKNNVLDINADRTRYFFRFSFDLKYHIIVRSGELECPLNQ